MLRSIALCLLITILAPSSRAAAQYGHRPNPYRTNPYRTNPYRSNPYRTDPYRPAPAYARPAPPAYQSYGPATYRPDYTYAPAYWTYGYPYYGYGFPYFYGAYHQPGFEYRGSSLPESDMPGLRSAW